LYLLGSSPELGITLMPQKATGGGKQKTKQTFGLTLKPRGIHHTPALKKAHLRQRSWQAAEVPAAADSNQSK